MNLSEGGTSSTNEMPVVNHSYSSGTVLLGCKVAIAICQSQRNSRTGVTSYSNADTTL